MFLGKYRETMRLHHGWEVELDCPGCGYYGLPEFHGWEPRYTLSFGLKPTIFARLSCRGCGRDLRDSAESKLVELFSKVRLPSRNRRMLAAFTAVLILSASAALAVPLVFGGPSTYLFPAFFMCVFFPLILLMNFKVSSIHNRCECGGADYLFMGMLGSSYCLRCSNCGRLLRLRD